MNKTIIVTFILLTACSSRNRENITLDNINELLNKKYNYQIDTNSYIVKNAFIPEFNFYPKNVFNDFNESTYLIKIKDSIRRQINISFEELNKGVIKENFKINKINSTKLDNVRHLLLFSTKNKNLFFLNYLKLVDDFDLKINNNYQYLLKNNLLSVSSFESFIVITDDNNKIVDIFFENGGVGK